jgi:DNA-binding response OmpR family regulator
MAIDTGGDPRDRSDPRNGSDPRDGTDPDAGINPRDGTVLIVGSDTLSGRELVEQLRADGYRATLAQTVEHARTLARGQPVRAIVLGELEPSRASLDLLEEIRSNQESVWDERLAVIVLGHRVGQLELLRAFELGADDFVVPPISYLELRVRLRALLRRVEQRPEMRSLRVGTLEIDMEAHLVRVDGSLVDLCRLEYELLVHLARNPTRVCSRQELLRAIWNQHRIAGTRTVDSHASRLRRKLNLAGAGGLVVNVWGVGYRLT